MCHTICPERGKCRALGDYEEAQTRLSFKTALEGIYPARQRLLPGWVWQEWLTEEEKEEDEKKKKRKEKKANGTKEDIEDGEAA